MKGNLLIMLNMAMASKFIPMGTSILAISIITKNMAKECFIGLLSLLLIKKKLNMSNFIQGNGGVAFLMAMALIKKIQEIFMMVLLRMA